MLRARVYNQDQLGDAKAFAFLPKLRSGGGHAECPHAAAGRSTTRSFGLEVCGGQRKFPGGQNISKVFLGSRLNWQAEALRARFSS